MGSNHAMNTVAAVSVTAMQQAAKHMCEAKVCAGGSSQKVISADKHIVNIWDASTAQNMTSLQPQEPGINDVLHWKESGLIMLGLDSPRIQACPFLQHLLRAVAPTCYLLGETSIGGSCP